MKQASTVYFAAVFLVFNLFLIFSIEGIAEKIAFSTITICTFACAGLIYHLDRKQEDAKQP